MPNAVVQTVFSDATLAIAKGAIALLPIPAKYKWILTTMLVVASIVDDLDALDIKGDDKLAAAQKIVIATLDGIDDVPGWRDLDEDDRDYLVMALVEITVFALRCAKLKRIPTPEEYDRHLLSAAVGDLVLFGLDLADNVAKPTAEATSGTKADDAIAAILNTITRGEAIAKALPQ